MAKAESSETADDWEEVDSDFGSEDGDDDLSAADIEALEAEVAALRASEEQDGGQQDSGVWQAENERLRQEVERLQQQDAAGEDSAASAASQEALLAKLQDCNAQLQRALAEGDTDVIAQQCSSADTSRSSTTAALRTALAASEERRKELEARLSVEDSARCSGAGMAAKAEKAAAELSARQKGVDLCFLIDCTSSMTPHITEMLQKVEEIFTVATKVHSEAIVRVAMVGYCDLCDTRFGRFEVIDFVGKDEASSFRTFLTGVRAVGGGDTCEDILGGLQEVMKLSWRSSTKLLIHIADCPCHGLKYHDPACSDDYPDGDPSGVAPETCVRWLCGRGIDYNFGEITEFTRQMTLIFKAEYDGSQAQFTIRSARDAATDFVPLLLNSISSSMGRSPFLSGGIPSPAVAAEADLSAGVQVPSFLTPLLR